MAAESFFTKVVNDVLDATEKLSTRLEEGISALMTGELPKKDGEEGEGPSSTHGSEQQGSSGESFEILDDDEFEGSPLRGMAESVLGDVMSGQSGPQTPMEHFHAFRHAINWTEPFILSLLVFHVVMFFLCLYVSRRDRGLAPRVAVMVLIAAIVRSAELLNRYAAANWEKFATQDYFDRRGVFVAIMVAAPLLFDSFIMLMMFLREASQLLVKVKTAELKKKKSQSKKEDTSDSKKRRAKKEQ